MNPTASGELVVCATQDMLRCTGEQSTAAIRWARCLSEIAKEASLLCQSSVLQAYVFVSKKIRKLMRHDSAGRQTIPVDVNDQKTLDAWRNYTSFACGCPPHKKTGRVHLYLREKSFHVIELMRLGVVE